jgi:5'-3' exonuclease
MVRVYLVDGTYEIFRQFFGRGAADGEAASEVGAARAVVGSMVSMLSRGVTHLGVATDHVIESFRNDLWPGYKSSAGVPEELLAQFGLLEDGLRAAGIPVFPMTDLEADDALASAAAVAAADDRVEKVFICTPDKDLTQCVRGERVVTLDRRKDEVTDEVGVWRRFGVAPASVPDWLALVGDSADGFPGVTGWGKQSASAVLAHYEHLEAIPDDARHWQDGTRRAVRGAPRLAASLAAQREDALLFRVLATLRIEPSVLASVDDLEWRGPAPEVEEVAARLRDPQLPGRLTQITRA